MSELRFALDIGTRSIVGLAFRYNAPTLIIEDYAIFEHSSRGMIDGQVQDIEEVARYASRVKRELVKKVGCDFTRAAIAFAGRSLHSRVITASLEFPFEQFIDQEIVAKVNQKAIHQGIMHGLKLNMYCVGYVKVGYILNDTPVRKPIGHYAHRITTRVLVTFLPREIVNSKIEVLRRLNLEPDIITLEPIAAGEIVFVERIRHLNLLLLDIGAGTTDLAVTSGGTVVGYTSIPVAGDEITEEISEAYLLDFEVAEKTKRLLRFGEQVSFNSVFGKHWTVPSQEVLDRINPRIKKLATNIKQACTSIFPHSISAVFCVGGGSFTLGLREAVSEAFALPLDRIIIPDTRDIPNLEDKTGKLYGPHWVTPLGIARAVSTLTGFSLLNITVNKQNLQALGMGRKCTVLEALGLRGFFPFLHRHEAQPGKELTFLLNGQKRCIEPIAPMAAQLFVNNQEARLEDEVGEGAVIDYEPGQDGKDAVLTVDELLEQEGGWIRITEEKSGQTWTWYFPVEINDSPVVSDCVINDGDLVSLPLEVDVETVLRELRLDPGDFRQREVEVWVSEQAQTFMHRQATLHKADDSEIKIHDTLGRRSEITIKRHPELSIQVNSLIAHLLKSLPPLSVVLNRNKLELPPREGTVFMDGVEVDPETRLRPGAKLTVEQPEQRPYVIADLLGQVETIVKKAVPGKRLIIRRNDEIVGFDTPLREDDTISIGWE